MNEMMASFDDYSIYKVKNKSNDVYYLCVPKQDVNSYQLFLGFADKDLSSMQKESVIAEIKSVNDAIQSLNSNAIFALPEIPVAELEQAALENDDRKYNEILVGKIQPITADIYRMLIEANRGTKQMNQTINVVKRNDTDKKFAGWLSMKMGDRYINEIDYDKMKEEYIQKDSENKTETFEKEDTAMESSFEEQSQKDMLDQTQEHSLNFSSGIAPINREYDNVPTHDRQNRLVRKLSKPTHTSPGFGNIKFIIITLVASLSLGIIIANLLMK